MMRLIAALLALTLALPAWAQDGIEQARAALAAAEQALESAQGRRARLAALGQAARAHEIALGAFRDGLRQMTIREARLRDGLARDSTRFGELIAALQSLARAPRSALLAYPEGPVGAARSATLMAEISPALETRIGELRDRLEQLRQLRSAQEVARIEARGALAALQDLRAETAARLRSRRTGAVATRDELRSQAELAGRRAHDLGALSQALKSSAGIPGAEAPLVRFSQARGLLPPPVAGSLVAGFGATDPWGRPGFGLTFRAPSFAEVIAPWDGTVRFAGPLIDYDQVVVLEPEEGWLIVLAGLVEVDRDVGEVVLAGERIGDLGGPIPSSDEFLLEGDTDGAQFPEKMLYLELRDGEKAVDPRDWFDLTDKRTRG